MLTDNILKAYKIMVSVNGLWQNIWSLEPGGHGAYVAFTHSRNGLIMVINTIASNSSANFRTQNLEKNTRNKTTCRRLLYTNIWLTHYKPESRQKSLKKFFHFYCTNHTQEIKTAYKIVIFTYIVIWWFFTTCYDIGFAQFWSLYSDL